MASTDLGLVGIVNKGSYDSTVTYNKGMFVLSGGSTWLCIKDNTKNVTPSLAATTNWQLMALGASTLLDFSAHQGTVSTYTAVQGVGTMGTFANNDQKLHYALNADKSVGKLYGWMRINGLVSDGTGQKIKISTNLKVKAPDAAYEIIGISGQYLTNAADANWLPVSNPWITIAADGTVGFEFIASTAQSAVTYTAITVYFPPCVYFFTDFGD